MSTARAVNPANTKSKAATVTSVSGRNRGGKKEALQTSLVALIAGLQANFAADFVFDLPTGPVTTSELLATFTQYVQAAETTKTQYQSWRTAVAAEKPIEQQATSARALVKKALLGRYGDQSPQLLQFGIAPYKVPVKTAAAKLRKWTSTRPIPPCSIRAAFSRFCGGTLRVTRRS